VIDFDSIAIAITSTQLGAIKATESSVLTSPVVRPWPPKAPFLRVRNFCHWCTVG